MSYILSWLEKQKTEDDWRERSTPLSNSDAQRILESDFNHYEILVEMISRVTSEFPVFACNFKLVSCTTPFYSTGSYNTVVTKNDSLIKYNQ